MKTKLFYLMAIAIFCLSSCGNDKEEIENVKTSYVVKYDETVKFEGNNNLIISNPFVASYDNGTIKGNHIGTTSAVYNSSKNIQITVNGTLNYIEYPSTNWNYTLSHNVGTLVEGETNVRMYHVKEGGSVKYIYMYNLDSSNRLLSSAVWVPISDVSIVVKWLSQKYFLVPYSSGDIAGVGYDAYEVKDAHTILGISSQIMSSSKYELYTKYWYMVVFSPSNNTSRANPESTMIDLLTRVRDKAFNGSKE